MEIRADTMLRECGVFEWSVCDTVTAFVTWEELERIKKHDYAILIKSIEPVVRFSIQMFASEARMKEG